jgi:hypothetical protein
VTNEPSSPGETPSTPPSEATSEGPTVDPARDDESLTPGGYAYEVVEDDHEAATGAGAAHAGGGFPLWAVALAAIIPAVVTALVVWFYFQGDGDGDGDGSSDRVESSTASLLNAFTQSTEGATTTRFEGEVPPGYPSDIPAYEGAEIIASVLQSQPGGAAYIIVTDTEDPRDEVAEALRERLNTDPWQIDLGQDSRDGTLFQFTRIDDADVSGLVLIGESKDGEQTVIITSVQQVLEEDAEQPPFTPAASRSTPADFPSEIPAYDGAVVIESAFRKEAGRQSFAISYITLDGASDVLDFYRQSFEDAGLSVEDGDASQSTLEEADAIRFADDELQLQGEVIVGKFGEDDSYTRIDVQVGDER